MFVGNIKIIILLLRYKIVIMIYVYQENNREIKLYVRLSKF